MKGLANKIFSNGPAQAQGLFQEFMKNINPSGILQKNREVAKDTILEASKQVAGASNTVKAAKAAGNIPGEEAANKIIADSQGLINKNSDLLNSFIKNDRLGMVTGKATQLDGTTVGGVFDNTKRYFSGSDFAGQKGRAGVVASRAGVAVGGLVGANTAGRIVTGNGGLLKDGDGRNDIAGIPFI